LTESSRREILLEEFEKGGMAFIQAQRIMMNSATPATSTTLTSVSDFIA